MTKRTNWLLLLFCLFGLTIALRLLYWQVWQSVNLSTQASLEHTSSVELSSGRGDILSADNFALVTNSLNYLLYVDPRQFPKTTAVLNQMAPFFDSTASAQENLITAQNSNLHWFAIAHSLSPPQKTGLEQLKIPGLGFEPEPGRTYPEGSSSAYLLGFVGQNTAGQDQGYFGLEGFYNRELSGRPGQLIQEHDAFNRPIVIGDDYRLSPQPGHSLVTSIDRTVQFTITRHLADAISKYHAEGGTVSVMDPITGRILGMASLPGYDPANFGDYSPDLYRNPIISDAYEPGSTFKTVVMASAIDAGVVTPETTCPTCSGPVTIDGDTIVSGDGHYYPNTSMPDIILHSDNIGMVFVSRQLGKTKMLNYIRRFGFGQLTGVDLQEESSPSLKPDDQWHDIDWATASFGQGVAVTRLQMLRAVSAIANLGKLPTPHLVTQIISQDTVKNLPDPQPQQIISPSAASAVTQMMIRGVNNGEVRYYKPSGYLIAGKTGTAQIPVAGHYDPNRVISSFIGFAPADNPKFAMLVTLDNPKPSQWGSTTAAPTWFGIASDLFRYFGIPPYN